MMNAHVKEDAARMRSECHEMACDCELVAQSTGGTFVYSPAGSCTSLIQVSTA